MGMNEHMKGQELLSRARSYIPRDVQSFRRLLPTLLILLGVVLLAYTASQYGMMFWEQRQLERQWAEQQERYSQQAATGQAATVVDDGLTRLSIPKIDLSAVVVDGTTRKKLLLGPGHLEDSALPGSNGNSVITAHRDTFFRHIVDLSKGDEVIVQRNGKTYTYEVTAKKIVQPDDVSVIKPTKDSRLTLITCYPTYYIGPAPERLIVISKLKEGEPVAPANPVSVSRTLPGDSSDSAK